MAPSSNLRVAHEWEAHLVQREMSIHVLRKVPALLSAILLSAHFFRQGDVLISVGCIVSPLLLVIRKTWAVRGLQILLLAGFFVWVDAGLTMYGERVARGIPWVRMVLIMSGVALFSVVSALLLEYPSSNAED
jgi:hypothetical protein